MIKAFTRYFSARVIGHQIQETSVEGSRTSGLVFYGHSPQGTVKLEMHQDPEGIDQLCVTLHDPQDESKTKQVYKGAMLWTLK